jgi:hypothetical protein
MRGSVAPNAIRALAIGITTAITVGCIRDTFTGPFSTASPFLPWIPDPWRSAYPWACVTTAAFAAIAARRDKPNPSTGTLSLAWVASLLLARRLAPAFYAQAASFIPLAFRDEVLVPCVFAGLALETLLPVAILGMLGLAGLRFLALRAGGGWPSRGRRVG